jgi:hypothetical protein
MNTWDKPLAAPGLRSYRCKGRFGWIMIGATDDADALREARRSSDVADLATLQEHRNGAYSSAYRFHVYVETLKTGVKLRMTAAPLTHSQACTMLSKITDFAWRRKFLEEANPCAQST